MLKITEFNENESPQKPNTQGPSSQPVPDSNGKLACVVSGIEREDVSAPRIRPPPTTFRVIGKENSVVPFY